MIDHLRNIYRVKEVDLKNDCVPKGLALEFQVEKITPNSFKGIFQKFLYFITASSLLMFVLIYYSAREADTFWTIFK